MLVSDHLAACMLQEAWRRSRNSAAAAYDQRRHHLSHAPATDATASAMATLTVGLHALNQSPSPALSVLDRRSDVETSPARPRSWSARTGRAEHALALY